MLLQILNVEFDFTDGEGELPEKFQKFVIEETVNSLWTVSSEDDIADAISERTGWAVSSIDYDILPEPGSLDYNRENEHTPTDAGTAE